MGGTLYIMPPRSDIFLEKIVLLQLMEDRVENIDEVILHWRESAEQDFSTMQNLLKSRDYSWALFLGHLVLEKLLKALYVKKFQAHAVFSHDLLRFAKKIELGLSADYEEWLDEITTFNLNARYDSFKQNFHQLCTKEFTEKWVARIETLRKWLINQF